VQQETPLVVAIHLCSTKIPYKSVGKEFLADQVEVEKEITNAIREAARDLRIFISRSVKMERQKHRLNIFVSTRHRGVFLSSGRRRMPSVKLLDGIRRQSAGG
jgi:DNA topoisomerase-6 subunit B